MDSQVTPSLDAVHLCRRQNWSTYLSQHAIMRKDFVALRFCGHTTTWAELDDRVSRLAGGLQRCGVGVGDRVLILMVNRTEFVESVLAINRVGGIAVPVNFRMAPPEIAYLLADCGACAVITESALAHVVAPHHLERLGITVVVAGDTVADGQLAYEELLVGSGNTLLPIQIAPDSPAVIMYTSGTTGRPKGAVLTHGNLTGQLITHLYTVGADIDSDVGFVGVPLFHIAGVGSLLVGLALGRPTVLYPVGAFDAAALLDVLEAEEVTSIFLVPAQWQAVCAEQRVSPRELVLRTLSWGAAPASDVLLREMIDVFPHTRILAAFGQTEMSPVTCMLLAKDALHKLGSVGKVIPTVAARVVDDNMNDVEVGEVGEIVYRAPTLMAGYWNNPQATSEAFEGGWFHSGDLVRQDKEGYVWVVDRKKDMIISGGENIYCAEVENALAGHPAIAEVAVVGCPDDKWGEVPVVVAALRTGTELTLADLDEYLTSRLARYKHPKVLRIVESLPRNPSGKVLKGELRNAVSSERTEDRS